MNFFVNLIRKNRFFASSREYDISPSTASAMKKVTVKISGEGNYLKIGSNCRIQNCEIRLKGKGNKIVIEDGVVFKSGKVYLLDGENQTIFLGKGTTVEGAYLLSDENASIYLGEDCMLATDVLIRTGDKHSIVCKNTGERLNPPEDVVLGSHVWVGRSVHILKGSSIASGSIVGARSLVNKKFTEPNIIVAGAPARVVKKEINWLRELI